MSIQHTPRRFVSILLLALFLAAGFHGAAGQERGLDVQLPYFGIRVVDESTGKGVPLVELRTVNGIAQVTDNAGWVAFHEPGLMDRDVYWHVSGPGIEHSKDGFGYAGFRAQAVPGKSVVVKVRNVQVAERVGRLTGQGLHRHAALLGLDHPPLNLREPGVTGQDSVQAVPYQNKIFWLWGDTSLERHPLGNFHTTSAWTSRDADPEEGLFFDYFTEPEEPGSLRRMLPSADPGVVWMFGLCVLGERAGEERLFAGFTRQMGLVPPDERGIAEFDDAVGCFRKVADVDREDAWHMPAGCAERVASDTGDHVYFCTPYAYRRVAATPERLTDPEAYEMFVFDEEEKEWVWRSAEEPTTQKDEERLLEAGHLDAGKARYQLKEAGSGRAVTLHTASIRWNAWRDRFVLLGIEAGGEASYLGEVWYAESDRITGPWRKAVQVASHPRYSFYNVVHHAFLDREGGRILYFEGTYTKQFSGNPVATPRYDYNQVMYRLDLADQRLEAAR